MTKKDLICIGCPLGCMLSVTLDGEKVTKVEGNTCIRGEQYGRKECTNPTRIVTSSVMVENGKIPMVSVKTQGDIPKEKIRECMKELKGIKVAAPVNIGDVIVKGIAGTNVNMVATKKVQKK
ncbi:MAG: DUF1667 domain-containing protein [Acetivibrio sp.]